MSSPISASPYEAGKSTCSKCRRILDDPNPRDCDKCGNRLCGNCCGKAAVIGQAEREAIAAERAALLAKPPMVPSPSRTTPGAA